nr:protein sidekick-2-like isoform X2 [Pocillopora verrucosa]
MVHQQSGLLLCLLCWIAVKAENPPTISSVTKTPVSFYEGGRVTLHCSATGNTPLTYQWFATDFEGNAKDVSSGRHSQQPSTGQLVINSLNHTLDDGYYYCVARNPAGRTRSTRLKIQVSFLEKTPNVDTSVSLGVLQGGEFTYEYPVIKSFPKPTITWTKSGSSMSETQRISFSTEGNIYIGNVEVNDVGNYYSRVENGGQSFSRGPLTVSVTARGNIPDTPYIILGPTNQRATAGKTNSVTFECFASGSPMPSISWRKAGQVISQSAKFSFDTFKKRLTVHNPAVSDEGVYECRVTNSKNVFKTKSANLTIIVMPTFTVTPTMADKYPQESVTFKCSATGTPTPEITWFHNGQKVPPSTTGRIQINSKNDLTFISLQSGDKGSVQCAATNDAGEILSKALLRVKELPVWIDVPPKNTDAVVNDTVELECVGRGNPSPTITWQKNDQNINFANNPRYFQKSSGSLQISRSQKSDSGKYTCIATNSIGSKRANASLRVLIKTVIVNPLPSQIDAIKGIDKLLPCGVQKDPDISVKWIWTKDGSAVDVSRMKVQSDGTLRILTVQQGDAGSYTCLVQSEAGNASTTGQLSVLEIPLAPTTPVVSDIKTTSVRLSWFPPDYSGNSPITSYKIEAKKGSNNWQLARDDINPSDRQMSVIVRNLSPHTQYQFRVRAVNQVGDGAPSGASGVIRTLISAPSAAPQSVSGAPTSADSILVQWQIPPPETHNGPLRGFKIAYRLAGVSASTFIIRKIAISSATQGSIDGLLQWTAYEIKVRAYNDAGDGVYSQPITVTTAEGLPTAPPQEVKVINITTVSVYLEWKPPPQKQQNGRIKGYKLQAWKGSTPSNIYQRVADHDDTAAIQKGILGGLEKFTQYTIAIVAYNGAGDSPRSDTKLIKTEEGVPDAPRSFTISEVYADALRVSWDPPLRLNGILTAYLVKHWRNDSLPSSGQTTRLSNVTLSHTVTGLGANTAYVVEVSAETRVGASTSKRLVAKTTESPVKPGAPQNLKVIEVRARSVVLDFTPGSSGRAPILTYIIQYNNDTYYDPASSSWKTLMIVRDAHLVWNLLPLELPHLKPYRDYRFRVTATNKVGSSSPSAPTDTIRTQETAPSLPPSNLTLLPLGKDGLELRWKIPPQDTWNSDFIGFILRFEPEGVPSFAFENKFPSSQLNYYRAGGLLRHKRYKVSVRSYNLNGKGASNGSAVAWAWTQEDAPSSAPTSLKPEVTGATSVTLRWEPVPYVGQNGVILGYKIYYRIFGKQNTEKEKELFNGLVYSTSLTGLESFVTYEFQILAYTRIGNGPKSAAVRATTRSSSPGPPSRVRFTSVSRETVTIAWDPPVYPRGVIQGYKAACRLNTSSASDPYVWQSTMGRNDLRRTAGPLNPQSFYRFYLWALTNTSQSEYPAEAVVYTGGSTEPPDAPYILPVYFSDIGERWIIVKWQATSDAKSPLRYFTLQLNKNDEGWQVYSANVLHDFRSLKVEGLFPGESYTFRIMATNDKGNSPYSAASSSVTTRLALPTGAPRNITVTSYPTSLDIKWAAPLPQELGGTLQGFILKHREKSAASSVFSEVSLDANSRNHKLERLKVFTVYEIKVAAVNEKGPGPYSPLYRVTTGEKPPSEAPKDLTKGTVTRTSIGVRWIAPSSASFNGHLMGYKVYAQDLSLTQGRRRRRRSLEAGVCPREPGPKLLFVPPHLNNVNITNLRKYVKYRIWVRAYNSKGESPPSTSLEVTTHEDRPEPPAVFRADAVYNARVDLYWKPPCEPNGEILEYEISYGRTAELTPNSDREKIVVDGKRETMKVTGLAMLTSYSFQLRARNPMGYGPPNEFLAKTKGPAEPPGQPGKPVVHPGSITAVIMWVNGDSGNVPFEKFEIQSQTDGSESFVTNWEANPDDTRKNRSYVSYTVGNLEPNTGYRFRIIAWNEKGKSKPSEPSDRVITGPADSDLQSGIIYKQWWFILLMVLFFIILVLLIAGFAYLCYRRRKDADQGSSAGASTTQSTLERMRNPSRNGTIRSGTLPSVQITYRDANREPEEDASSLGSKEEPSDSDSGVSEMTYKRKQADINFIGHYSNNPNHQQWKNSLGRTRPANGRNLIEHTTEESDTPEEVPISRALKSFSAMSLPRDKRDGPPAYDNRRFMAKSADQLDRIERSQLPPEAVTSFMSPDYEQKQKRPAYRDRKEPYSRSRATRPAGSLRRSRDQMDYNDDSSTPPRSPTRPNTGIGYLPKTEIQNRNRRDPRSNSFRRALDFDPNPRDSDGSSKYSDRASSSSNDHRDTRTNANSMGRPRIQYDEEPGRRRRQPQQLPSLQMKSANKPPRYHTPPSPLSPVSPAPSYHTVDPVFGGRISPVPSYHGSSRDGNSDHSDGGRIPPPVLYMDRTGHNNENFDSSEPHISTYSSFV